MNNKRPLLIYGAGGLGREIASFITGLNDWYLDGFIDDTLAVGTTIAGVEVKGTRSLLANTKETKFVVVAIANPEAKRNVVTLLRNNPNVKFPVLVHQQALLQAKERIVLGDGAIICAGTILTTDIQLGEHVLLNLNVTVGHDTIIGSYSSIMPGVNISGNVSIGESVFIGSGANVRNKLTLGDNSVIGMGSVVLKDVNANTTVAGVPAKKIA